MCDTSFVRLRNYMTVVFMFTSLRFVAHAHYLVCGTLSISGHWSFCVCPLQSHDKVGLSF